MIMKKWSILVGLTIIHAFLTLYSFGVLFGLGFMQAEDRPKVTQAVWTKVMLVTWQPLLMATHDHIRNNGRRLFDTHPYPFVAVNSIAAVGLGYMVMCFINRVVNKKRRTNGNPSHPPAAG
jgi:hypothetical protein